MFLQKKIKKRVFLLSGMGLVLLLLGLCFFSAVFTLRSFAQLKKGHLNQATLSAKVARSVLYPVHLTLGKIVPDIQVWHLSLSLVPQLDQLQQDLSGFSPNSKSETTISQTLKTVSDIHQTTTQLEKSVKKSFVVQKIASVNHLNILSTFNQTADQLLPELTVYTSEKQYLLILLQNSDELRPTGGFLGSYVLVLIENDHLQEIILEDIYDADGQFTGFIEPPPGVAEYLSGGEGLRLPNANWSPDFARSSQEVLRFFALGERSNISVVVGITVHLAEKYLAVTGPLLLPDYDTHIDANNINVVLRTERSQFFPGSGQKKHLLSQALDSFLIKLETVSNEQLKEMLVITQQSIIAKDLQLYSTRPSLQEVFSKWQTTGTLELIPSELAECNQLQTCQPAFFFPVEANVGINKANRAIEREIQLTVQGNKIGGAITFHNDNIPQQMTALTSQVSDQLKEEDLNHRGYVNYMRLLVDPTAQVTNIVYDGKPITIFSQGIRALPNGESYQEVGFLLELEEEKSKTLRFTIETPKPITHLVLPKQAGISQIPLVINQKNFLHTKDSIIQLSALEDH